jgi:hypothetical protein
MHAYVYGCETVSPLFREIHRLGLTARTIPHRGRKFIATSTDFADALLRVSTNRDSLGTGIH